MHPGQPQRLEQGRVTGRDELRQKGHVEDHRLGIEHVGQQPLTQRHPGRHRRACGAHGGDRQRHAAPRAEQTLHAEPDQVGGAHQLEQMKGPGRLQQNQRDPQRRHRGVHEQPAADRQAGEYPVAHAAPRGVANHQQGVHSGAHGEQDNSDQKGPELGVQQHAGNPPGDIGGRHTTLSLPTARAQRQARRLSGRSGFFHLQLGWRASQADWQRHIDAAATR